MTLTAAPATVRHISKDHVRITPAPGWSVVLFNVSTAGAVAEAVVTSDDGSETIRLGVAAPKVGQYMNVKVGVEGNERGVDIVYGAKVND